MSSVNSIDENLNNSINQIENIDSSSKGKSTSECNQELRDKFNEIMSNDNDKSQKMKNGELLSQNKQAIVNDNLSNKEELSSIFSQLMSNSQIQNLNQNDLNIVTTSTEVTTATTALAQDTQKIVDELVERILISDPDINGNQQVVIQLGKDSILNGTEIILTRALDGTLGVLINPKDRDQFKTLAEAKQDLELSLQKHEKGMINITINDSLNRNGEQPYRDNQYNQFNDPYSFV